MRIYKPFFISMARESNLWAHTVMLFNQNWNHFYSCTFIMQNEYMIKLSIEQSNNIYDFLITFSLLHSILYLIFINCYCHIHNSFSHAFIKRKKNKQTDTINKTWSQSICFFVIHKFWWTGLTAIKWPWK